MTESCKICGRWNYSGGPHQCPPKWLVWCPEHGREEQRASTVYETDAEEAAKAWAEDDDCYDGEYPLAADPQSCVVVFVRPATGGPTSRFKVRGEFTPDYYADEIEGDDG